MTDEEKKAIEKIEMLMEYLKKWNKNFTVVPEDAKYFEKILDMTKTHIRMIDENIEELLQQSKEIEELKEENEKYKNPPFFDEDKYIENDKIKAKIEPVLKQLERKMQEEYNKYGNSGEYQDIVDAYNFLQSLLEKE